jgi:putative ABC transport system permease protein
MATFPSLESLWQDARYGARTLRKSPGFTAAAILTLALGIGANTAIFTLVNALLLKSLPVRNPTQLVELLHKFPDEPAFNGFSGEAYQLLRDQNRSFSGLVAATHEPFSIRDTSETHEVPGGYVDGTFFSVLGLKPALGRLIGPDDDRSDNPSPVVVLGWSYWKRNFNSDPAILGKRIHVGDVPVSIVGVAPRGFAGLSQQYTQDIWLPLSMHTLTHPTGLGWGSPLALVGRLKPGVSVEQARAEMTVLFHATLQAPNANPFLRNMKFDIESAGTGLSSPLRQQFSTPLLVLLAVVLLLLLIASSNIASLLLARGAASQHEMAVRVALGASRSRLVSLALIEPLLLASAGALLALVFSYFGASALVHIILSGRLHAGTPTNYEIQVRPDTHVLLFTAAIALLTVLLSGLSPAIRAVGAAPASALRQAGSAGETKLRRLFGKSLLVSQVALSAVLLSAAALFIGYLSNLEHLNLGFRRDHLLLVTLDPSKSGYNGAFLSGLSQELLDRLKAIPGVRSATLSAMTPVSGRGRACYCVTVEGHEEPVGDHRNMVFINSVAPNYFETYGMPLLIGRRFTPQDQTGSRAAIINHALARYYFGDASPVGKHLTFDLDDKPYEIVGVVGDAKYSTIREIPPPTIYLDTFQEKHASTQFTLRTAGDPMTVALEVRQALEEFLRSVPVASITTMADQVDATIVPERLIATLATWFASLGLLLVAIGLYGLLSYSVTRRISEMGVRMALGATKGDISRMVLGDALRTVFVGLAIGAPIAFWAKALATHFIQDLPRNNVTPISIGSAALLAVAIFSAYLPARRATRVDPVVALRYE